jgi:hypothetical protein
MNISNTNRTNCLCDGSDSENISPEKPESKIIMTKPIVQSHPSMLIGKNPYP